MGNATHTRRPESGGAPRPVERLLDGDRERALAAQIISRVVLVLSLLFLYPTFTYFIGWLFVKTTFQLAQLYQQVDRSLVFPLSFFSAYLGYRSADPESPWRFRYVAVYFACFLTTFLLTPIFIPGAVLLALSGALLDEHRDRWSRILASSLAMILAIVAFWGPLKILPASRSMELKARADLVVVSIALERYYADHHAYPQATLEPGKKEAWHSASQMPALMRPLSGGPATLTSPAAYLKAPLADPFRYLDEERAFAYWTEGRLWILVSAGPNCVFDMTPADLRQICRESGDWQSLLLSLTYDPSNGTESSGDLWRLRP